jgi:superfamily II DNA/RNA helicase
LSTIENRLKRLKTRTLSDDIQADISTLGGLRLAIQAIKPNQFSKYQRLIQLLKTDGSASLGWSHKHADDRLVIFTESLVTLDFLQKNLPDDLGVKPQEVSLLRGDMHDKDLMEAVEQFNKLDSPVRMLLCSDVASEGINLHHLSHRLIHFDIPWSLMVFQQRNGRIDRYGQQRQPQIRYLLTASDNARVRGDMRVLDILIEKDSQAGKNIGDPSEFMGKFNTAEEEALTATVIEQDKKDDDDISDIFADLLNNTESTSDLLAHFTPDTPPSSNFEQVLSRCPKITCTTFANQSS